jgi:hypothetical protein
MEPITLSSLRYRANSARYQELKNTLIQIPGRKSPMTIREIWAEARADKKFWNRVMHLEFTPPAVPAPVASPLIVGAKGKTVKALLDSLRAQRDQADAAIAAILKKPAFVSHVSPKNKYRCDTINCKETAVVRVTIYDESEWDGVKSITFHCLAHGSKKAGRPVYHKPETV